MALFLSYGKEDHHMDRYMRYLKTRSYAIDRWKNMVITEQQVKEGEKIGLKILSLTDVAKQINPNDVHEKHVELDY
jgi:hypothetical protein